MPGVRPRPNIYKVNPDGSDNVPLVTGTSDDSYPVFSPGGGKIVFSSDRDEELYIKNADGSGNAQ